MLAMKLKVCILLGSSLLLPALALHAQELSPRAYWPSPVGTQVVTVGYSYNSGDIIPDRSLPLTGVDSDIDSFVLGYRRTLGMWGRTASITVEAPYVNGTTEGTHEDGFDLEREYEGIGDLGVTFSANLLGAPAMNPQEFRLERSNFRHVLGASLKVVAPTGKYDSNKIINIGANRWAAKAELGYIAVLNPKWVLETSLGVWFFEDNDDFLDMTKEQEPVVSLQGHVIHRFRPGFWASLDLTYYEGGRSTLGGRRLDDLQRDTKVGGTLVFPLAPGRALKLGYTKGSLSDSDEDFDIFVMSYSQLF